MYILMYNVQVVMLHKIGKWAIKIQFTNALDYEY